MKCKSDNATLLQSATRSSFKTINLNCYDKGLSASNNFIEFESFEMFNKKNVDMQSANAQLIIFKNSNEKIIDALLLQISLSFKFKIIKFEKMRIYKSQSENEHQR